MLVARMGEGIYPQSDWKDGFRTIEAKITGLPTYADSSMAFPFMLSSLSDIERIAQVI